MRPSLAIASEASLSEHLRRRMHSSNSGSLVSAGRHSASTTPRRSTRRLDLPPSCPLAVELSLAFLLPSAVPARLSGASFDRHPSISQAAPAPLSRLFPSSLQFAPFLLRVRALAPRIALGTCGDSTLGLNRSID